MEIKCSVKELKELIASQCDYDAIREKTIDSLKNQETEFSLEKVRQGHLKLQ